jgi:hypothetical protein
MYIIITESKVFKTFDPFNSFFGHPIQFTARNRVDKFNKMWNPVPFDSQIKFFFLYSKWTGGDTWNWTSWTTWRKIHSAFVAVVLGHVIVLSFLTMLSNWEITEDWM